MSSAQFGKHRGGMFIELTGERDDVATTRSWHLIAKGDGRPLIPSMACEAVIRKLLKGERPEPGARPATGALSLSDFTTLFEGRDIHTGFRRDNELPLYPKILGDQFTTLPASIQALHQPGANSVWKGQATVKRGTTLITTLIAKLNGFPAAGTGIPVQVTLTSDSNGVELWTRRFAEHEFQSTQFSGKGRREHLMCERFGPMTFAIALEVRDQRLYLVQRGWRFMGLPMPNFLLPKGEVWEAEIDERFHFHVDISLPIFGRVVLYDGWLEPV